MLRIAVAIFFTFLIINPCLASNAELKNSWNFYKSVFINQDGRVIDYQKNGITTSEGQSYALLRAVLINDKQTFAKVYNWTKNNLKRNNDYLFAWLWGEKNGTYCKLDENSATDSDIDIAFALLLASKKWGNPYYSQEAKNIIADIWKYETISIKDKRILTAGYDQTQKDIIDINPSYFAPYAFRLFANYDKNDWNLLINDNYELLANVINLTQSKLPPDWFTISKNTGAISVDTTSQKSDFSYDAVRVFFRIYLDYKFNEEKKAEMILPNIKFFISKWNENSHIYTNVKSMGDYRDYIEAKGSIAILLPVINLYNKEIAMEIYNSKIKTTYNKKGYWGSPFDYYAQNLIWFGMKEMLDGKQYSK